ncbi:MAG: 4Fe-4S binding protein [Candidatus Omnitrophota bacterium]
MKILRRISQIIFLFLFLFLLIQTEYRGRDSIAYPVKIFLELDPLVFIATLIATHKVIGGLLLCLFVVAITVTVGRIFCGWVCPLGSLHNALSFAKRKRYLNQAQGQYDSAQAVKYYVLIFLLIGALFSFQFIGIFDPLSLLIRSLSLAVFPALSFLTELTLRKNFLSFRQPYYRDAVLFGLILLGVLLVNIKRRRLWCKYICPLGTLLGLLSFCNIVKLKVNEQCNSCMSCCAVCQGGCSPNSSKDWRRQECFICFNCVKECPKKAISFGFSFTDALRPNAVDIKRRHIIQSLLGGLFIFPLLKINPSAKLESPGLIRPPGSKNEGEFLSRCIRCSECMKVCLTGGLQPVTFEAGIEGIWTPVLVPRIGYCEFNCTLCSQVCPTGAIGKISLKEKQHLKIGLAFIDKNRCLPHAFGIDCIVCEEHCPTSPKAIRFKEVRTMTEGGTEALLKQPLVDPGRCIGCGICEYKCPVIDRPAIYITSINESRSNNNVLTV